PSTTWPTHASLVTGVSPRAHGVVANYVWNRRTRMHEDLTGDPIYDAPDLLRAPTVYDSAHAAGMRTAAIDWPATRNARTLHFNLPFFKDQHVFEMWTARAVWDHGFLPPTRESGPNVRLRVRGAAREAGLVTNHGAGARYALDGDAGSIGQLTGEIAKMEGVSGAWTASNFEALGLPTPAENALMGDAMFEAAPGYAFGDLADGVEEHGPPKYLRNHGQRAFYPDNHALFVAARHTIRRGVQLPVIRSRDIPPT